MNSLYENNKKLISKNNNKKEEEYDLKTYIKNLEEKIKYCNLENEKLINLNKELEKEKLELNASLELKEITINQQLSLLDNLKNKNENYEIRIIELEKINQELNYIYIELSEKNKTLIENQKNNLSDSSSKNTTDQLIKFSNQLENLSIIKSRLEHDNKILVNKINYIQLENENERNMLKKIHSLEIEKKNKIVLNLQEEISQLNTLNKENNSNNYKQIINEYSNLEEKTRKISNENFNLKSLIQDLQSKLNIYEEAIKRKDNYIKELQNNLRNSEEELKLISVENETINEESKLIIEKINNEKNDLLKQNKEFRNAYEQFNIIINNANNMYIQKIKNFEDLIRKKDLKLNEYEKQNNELNEKNNLLSYENEKLKRENNRYEKSKNKHRFQRNKSLNLNDSKNMTLNTSSSKKNHFENKTVDSIKENNNLNSNISINMYNNLDDPFIVSQQQSLELFKNILQKYNI